MILHASTIALSAFLLFLLQPIVAKQILPWFGGSAAVWTTCMVFFQTVLLAAAMFALGTGARLSAFRRLGARPVALATASTLIVGGVALGGTLLVA